MYYTYLGGGLEGFDRFPETFTQFRELRGPKRNRGHDANHEQLGSAQAEKAACAHRRAWEGVDRRGRGRGRGRDGRNVRGEGGREKAGSPRGTGEKKEEDPSILLL